MLLTDLLIDYVPMGDLEQSYLVRLRSFAVRYRNPFDRTIAEGHVTGSAFILDASGQHVLLLHHRKVGRWLQPGGHAGAGEADPEGVALREAREETGINDLVFHPTAPRPLDLDIHEFPAHGTDPAHWHFDIRYLLVARDEAEATLAPEEATDLRWFGWDELAGLALDTGTERALTKARALGIGR